MAAPCQEALAGALLGLGLQSPKWLVTGSQIDVGQPRGEGPRPARSFTCAVGGRLPSPGAPRVPGAGARASELAGPPAAQSPARRSPGSGSGEETALSSTGP